MATKVEMWCATYGSVGGAEDCYTDGLFDCVALAVTGKDAKGGSGYYFGHLTSYQYQMRVDKEGNAVKALKAFLAEYSSDVWVISAVNHQPMPDFTQSGLEKIRPTCIASLVCHLVQSIAEKVTFADMWYLGEGAVAGGTVTFKPASATLHKAGPDSATIQNEVRTACTKYNTWPASAIVEEQRRRQAERAPARSSWCAVM